jgi:UDP-N-acetylmuramyl pentapeptide phosphotransferase/UDP-N-acetylglucosamine-1-phosphate transferase
MYVLNTPNFSLIVGALTAFLICQLIILTQHIHGKHTGDNGLGVQKIHLAPTPRVGGIAIAVGLAMLWFFSPLKLHVMLTPIFLAAIPAFFSGLIEDIGKRGVVSERLLATCASGAIAWVLTGISIRNLGFSSLNWILEYTLISVLFTAFAVGGLANAINIIDGVNGLASGVVVLSLLTIGVIAHLSGDADLEQYCLAIICVTAGFMVVNYPLGKIFLGDGGAYMLGFLLGWGAVMLTVRNTNISPWSALLACSYPIIEVLFSMLRRSLRTHRIGQPDRLHLHSLLWARIARIYFPNHSKNSQNSIVFPMVMSFALIPAGLAVYFRGSTFYLIISLIMTIILYALIYFRLIYFRWKLPTLFRPR